MRPKRRRQQGSVIVLMAFMSLLLVAFVGIAVDGGEITAQARSAQNAADGAALAAGWDIVNNGYTLDTATALAQVISQQNGAFPGDLTMTYKDGNGSTTTSPGSVATVQAAVSHSFNTLFLPIISIDSATVQVSATVTVTGSTGCALCLLSVSANPSLNVNNGASLNVSNGSIAVDSTGSSALADTGGASITATAISVAGGDTVSNGASISPAPILHASGLSDPLSAVPVPSVSGPNWGTYTSPAGSTATINPGIYASINIGNGSSVTMTAGTYVVEGAFSVQGGSSVTASSVMLYLACSSYPAACTAGQAGGSFSVGNGSSMTLTAPGSGAYAGMAIFADRRNTSTVSLGGGGSLAITGTVYAASGPIGVSNGASSNNIHSRVVGSTLTLAGGASMTITFASGQNYSLPGTVKLAS